MLGEGRQRLELVDPDPIEDKCQGMTLWKMTYQKEIGLSRLPFVLYLYSIGTLQKLLFG